MPHCREPCFDQKEIAMTNNTAEIIRFPTAAANDADGFDQRDHTAFDGGDGGGPIHPHVTLDLPEVESLPDPPKSRAWFWFLLGAALGLS
jgi:hypothetical protein